MEGESGGSRLSEKELVDAVLRDLNEAAERWEAVVAQAATITYSVDMGDLQAVANSDGRLIDLSLHPSVMTDYNHRELADRLNAALTALREEAQSDHQARYGGSVS